MAVAAVIFGILALRYKEYKPNNNDSEDQQLIINKNSPEFDQIIE